MKSVWTKEIDEIKLFSWYAPIQWIFSVHSHITYGRCRILCINSTSSQYKSWSVRRRFSVGQCNSVFSISVITASVNTNVGATRVTSADSVSAFTGSVSTDAGGVSAISAISVSIVNASVNADVPFSVVSILKLPIPKWYLNTKVCEDAFMLNRTCSLRFSGTILTVLIVMKNLYGIVVFREKLHFSWELLCA